MKKINCFRKRMKKLKVSKKEAKNKIENFFKEIKEKSPLEIKKIKKIAMNKRISLGENKKLFCKKCFFPFVNPKIRIKKGFKIITCEECGAIKRIKIK